MSIIARDTTFSWESPLIGDNASVKTASSGGSHAPHSKQMERRIVNAWKSLTRSTRKQKRVSVYAKDFVFVTATEPRRHNVSATQDTSPVQSSRRRSQSDPLQHHTI